MAASTLHSAQTRSATPQQPAIRELVIMDAAVPDRQMLLDGLRVDVDVVLLDGSRDGVEQITEALADRQNLKALHLISHGQPGQIELGNGVLGAANLATYAPQLITWGEALADDADLLIYGCEVGIGAAGSILLQQLHRLTGVNIAASTTPTGHADKGGDWNFDVAIGEVETALAITVENQQSWAGILTTLSSNFGFTSNFAGSSNNTNQFATAFTTDGTGGTIGSITIRLGNIGTLASAGDVEVALFTDNSGEPGTQIALFDDPATVTGGQTDNIFTAPGAGITVAPNTTFHVVFRSASAVTFQAGFATSTNQTGWDIADAGDFSSNGGATWSASGGRLSLEITEFVPPAPTPAPTAAPTAVITVTDPNGNAIADGGRDPITFGVTPAGTAPTQTFTVRNSGNGPASISNLRLPDEFTLVGNLPTELAAGQSFPLTVQFNPNRSGRQGGIIGFRFGSEFFNFNLEGIGELPVPTSTAPDGTNPDLPPATTGSEDTDDAITGTSDSDAILGLSGNDVIDGGDANDFLFGWAGDDSITGGAGDDFARGGSGNDVLIGDSTTSSETGGDDTLIGGAGNDLLLGQKGNDVLSGEAGDDTLNGGMGNDILFGGAGNDIIAGDLGDDILIGNDGVDTFVVGSGSDVIQDFLNGTDLIQLPSGVGFSDLTITNDAVNTTITTADSAFTVTLNNVISTLTATNFV